MASVHWPSETTRRSRRFNHLSRIPYLLDGSERYPDGINAYIYERVRGSIRGKGDQNARLKLKPLGKHSTKKIAFNLCDAMTWMESRDSHPMLGSLDWKTVQPWHLTELYLDAMINGTWSEEYFASRIATSVYPATANERMAEMLRCLAWAAQQGFREPFDHKPEIVLLQRAKDDALLAYRRESLILPVEQIPQRVRNIRKQPGSESIPTMSHIKSFLLAVPERSVRLVLAYLFETAMRIDEILNNSLLPGRTHSRILGQTTHWHPKWSGRPIMLCHSLSDDSMLGVLPPSDMAWNQAYRHGYQCQYRILGKGPKIRLVHVPPKLIQSTWTHVATRGHDDSPYAFLNKKGGRLNYQTVWQACDAASRKVAAPLNLTCHVLRHAHACYFLELALLNEAKRLGHRSDQMPLELLQRFGEGVLLVIQQQLGHAEFKTTQIYLRMIIEGRIGLTYHKAWNEYLDDINDETGAPQ